MSQISQKELLKYLERPCRTEFSLSLEEICKENEIDFSKHIPYKKFESMNFDGKYAKELAEEFDISVHTIRNWIPSRRGSKPMSIQVRNELKEYKLLDKNEQISHQSPNVNHFVALNFLLFHFGNQIKGRGSQYTPTIILREAPNKLGNFLKKMNCFDLNYSLLRDEWEKSKVVRIGRTSFTPPILSFTPEMLIPREDRTRTPKLAETFPEHYQRIRDYFKSNSL